MRILPFFNRFFLLFAAVGISTLPAQTLSFTVSSNPVGASFTVDGQTYSYTAQFQWPAGSKHVVSFVQNQPPAGSIVPNANGTFTGLQLMQNGTEMYTFGGWQDSTGFLAPTQDLTQVVTADGSITSLTANVTLSYRVLLTFGTNAGNIAPVCGAPGTPPPSTLMLGYVYINNDCYWNSAIVYYPAESTLVLNAFPLPGFVFTGWSGSLAGSKAGAYLQSYVLTGAIEVIPDFGAGKRVNIETKPLGLNVLIDRTQSPTVLYDNTGTTCPNSEYLPLPVASNDPPLCFGDFDFVAESKHLIAAPSPQRDLSGNLWVFDSWTSTSGQSGQAQNTIYATGSQLATPDKVIVAFDPGVGASFVTVPSGLELNVDGQENWPSYNFVWALGSTHQVTAPAQQPDATGRQWTFSGWSNGGSASQPVTMTQADLTAGFRITATYSELSRVVVQSVPSGQKVTIDGATCLTPCNVDRANGTQVHIVAPNSVPVATGARLDFSSWSNGAPSDQMYTVSSNLQTLTASYQTKYQLSASGNPANGVKFAFNPTSSDSFYPANTNVAVTATALNGFKFVRWNGDLNGTYPSGSVSMGGPQSVIALLVAVPYIAPAGVENGAGATPEAVVAAGSIAMILGQSLSPGTVAGPVNPLAQTIDNVTVMLGDRLLPLFSVSPEQITLLLPSDLAPGVYMLGVQSPGQPVVTSDFTVVRDAPGIFTNPSNSKAYILALHKDGSLVTQAKPAVQGEQITFFGTGFGPYNSPVVDGFFPPTPAPTTVDPVSIVAAGQTFQADWSGAAAGYTGLVAVKLTITNAFPTATDVNLQVEIYGHLSNTVVLPLQ